MRTKKLIYTFELTNDNRSNIYLGPDVRLEPDQNFILLAADADGAYPTAADLFARTWAIHPTTVKQWLGFEAKVEHVYDDLNVALTSIKYRLGDGTDEYWWNGSAWVVNNLNWNTEAEIATNIPTFPAIDQRLQVIANLKTDDEEATPKLYTIKILYASDIEFQEDVIYRSLVPTLRESIRPIGNHPVKVAATSNTINLGLAPFVLKTPYNVVGIDAVFDHTNDPNHTEDLVASYNPNTKVITLSQPIAAGDVAWIQFLYEPEVVATTKRTYTELDKVPALVVSDIEFIGVGSEAIGDDTVVNKATGLGFRVLAPIQSDVEFTIRCLTDKAQDQHRLADEVKRHFRQNPLLRSRGMDIPYRVRLVSEYQQQGLIGQDETEVCTLRFRIVSALFYNRGDAEVAAVTSFTLRGPPDLILS